MKIYSTHAREFLPHGIAEGSISTGTLLTAELVSRFHRWIGDNCVKKPSVYYEILWGSDEELEYLLEELISFLDSAGSAFGYRFGPHEGDGADIGFWKEEE